MTAMTMLEHFTWTGQGGSSFNTPWIPFPSDYRRAELWIDVKSVDTGTLTVNLESSADSDHSVQAATEVVGAPGISVSEISSKLGPMIRLSLQGSGTPASLVVSIWVLPKRD